MYTDFSIKSQGRGVWGDLQQNKSRSNNGVIVEVGGYGVGGGWMERNGELPASSSTPSPSTPLFYLSLSPYHYAPISLYFLSITLPPLNNSLLLLLLLLLLTPLMSLFSKFSLTSALTIFLPQFSSLPLFHLLQPPLCRFWQRLIPVLSPCPRPLTSGSSWNEGGQGGLSGIRRGGRTIFWVGAARSAWYIFSEKYACGFIHWRGNGIRKGYLWGRVQVFRLLIKE